MADRQKLLRQELLRRELAKREAANPDGTFGTPPEGMVLNPKTGQLVDAKSIAENASNRTAAGAVANFLKGVPIIGGKTAEIAAMGDPVRTEVAKQHIKQFADERPVTSGALNVGGTAATVLPLIFAAPALMGASGKASLAQNTAMAGLSGGAIGAADAAVRSDGDVDATLRGGIAGFGTGAVGPALGKAAGAVARPLASVFGMGNRARANDAVSAAISRSGQTSDDIARKLAGAAADGQPEYMMADALGTSGQRMLAGVARTPGDARQRIVDTLIRRQSGQADRLTNALAEGFDASDTAAQRVAGLTAQRSADAARNYGAARGSAGAVDTTQAIALADDFLSPSGVPAGVADDSVSGLVARARGLITDGQSPVTDFDSLLRRKIDLDGMIENASGAARAQLIPIRNAIDDALANASEPYAAARNTYRTQSQAIDAVDVGAKAAGSRARATDNVQTFANMSDDAQAQFRAGYGDDLIRRVEAGRSTPTANRAGMFETSKFRQEIPVIAGDKAPQLQNRIQREADMFQTANAAMGGSKTADNLADAAEVGGLDAGIISSLLSGNLRAAAIQGATRATNALGGQNQATRELIADALMQTSPQASKRVIDRAVNQVMSS